MPSTDITFCRSTGCPRCTECWRWVGPGPGIFPGSSWTDFRAIWGDNCGAYVPWAGEKETGGEEG